MKNLTVIAAVLAVVGLAEAKAPMCSVLLGDVQEEASIGHFGAGKRLTYWIEYLDMSGYTTVDALGIHWNWAGATQHGNIIFPQAYYGDAYPLYFIGNTMRVRVHITNQSKKPISHLRVSAIQEYLNFFGGDGANLGGPSTSEFYIDRLNPKTEWVGEATYYIPGGTAPGLDQTHLVVSQCSVSAKGCCKKQKVLVSLPQAGIYCPPEEIDGGALPADEPSAEE